MSAVGHYLKVILLSPSVDQNGTLYRHVYISDDKLDSRIKFKMIKYFYWWILTSAFHPIQQLSSATYSASHIDKAIVGCFSILSWAESCCAASVCLFYCPVSIIMCHKLKFFLTFLVTQIIIYCTLQVPQHMFGSCLVLLFWLWKISWQFAEKPTYVRSSTCHMFLTSQYTCNLTLVGAQALIIIVCIHWCSRPNNHFFKKNNVFAPVCALAQIILISSG